MLARIDGPPLHCVKLGCQTRRSRTVPVGRVRTVPFGALRCSSLRRRISRATQRRRDRRSWV